MHTKPLAEKYDFLLPLGLFSLFMALTLPGISTWGGWHPDEIAVRSIKALYGEWQFSEINFDYPDLPQYAMFWLGKLVLAIHPASSYMDLLTAMRFLSATVAGLTVVLTYFLVRRMGGGMFLAGLGGLLLISISELSHNGRFAHNDTYVTFFATLAVFFLVIFKQTGRRGWAYASFVAVGMAASSKYNGISLVLAPLLFVLLSRRHNFWTLRTFETLAVGGALTYLGFALGTPKALTWMAFYFKRMLPALLRTGNYLRQPDSVRGYIGQYGSLIEAMGWPLFLLLSGAVLWAVITLIRRGSYTSQTGTLAVILVSMLALDLPVMISYNYPTRFLLPLMPLFAALGAFFIEDVYRSWGNRRVFTLVLTLIIGYSLARNISVMLLFLNDARIAASAYIQTLPPTSLEHTYYPPDIPENYFAREHNYPIYFRKAGNEPLPVSPEFKFNAGEAGLVSRQTDFFVVDGFTADKFNNPFTCADMQVECDFFKDLADDGRSPHYRLKKEFSYSLPRWLPQLEITFVNPSIRIYERIP